MSLGGPGLLLSVLGVRVCLSPSSLPGCWQFRLCLLTLVVSFVCLRPCMHVLAALHGAEASVVAQDGLRKLRTAFVRAVLSGALTLAAPGAVPSLLEGLVGCDPGCHVVQILCGHMAENLGCA